ncbi:hypothetical protein [Methylobacterium sp. Leaf108]|uniref:hypothetical protein n=1 Tax=Methylobacterium sp. Leaf108 TaxID=1736256 RepID=UPI00070087D9|nr:hypothetical protein [Methylobacterium sp. Leaf108]KQP53667.1 hypothetical protein ASF39_19870 [Methylobacterium sp. Leaf108]
MPRALDAQTFGSIVVIGTFGAAEAAAAYLSAHPASELAWYLTLAVFRPFEYARADTSPLHVLFGPSSLPLAAACLVITLCLRVLRSRFGIAVVANSCFALTAALVYAWWTANGLSRSASLMPVASLQRPDLAVVALMMASSCLAFLASHLSFVAIILSDRRASRPSVSLPPTPSRMPVSAL